MNLKLISALILMLMLPLSVISQTRETIVLTEDWKFKKGGTELFVSGEGLKGDKVILNTIGEN
ncbi:MAG: hypothetical protein QNK30_01710 [Bacteroidales bacterium]|nr:hypothetical protein [Bacteroidales bacterium]